MTTDKRRITEFSLQETQKTREATRFIIDKEGDIDRAKSN